MLTLPLMLLIGGLATADQEAVPHVGVRGGVDVTTVADYATGAESGAGAVAGVYLALPVWRHFNLQPEASFSLRRFTLYRHGGVPLAVPYVDVGLLLIVPTGFGRNRLFAVAGPAFAIRVGGAEEANVYGAPPGDWRRLGLSLVLGAGVSAPVGRGRAVGFEIRHVRGLQDVDPESYYSHPFLRSWQFAGVVEWRVKQ